MKLTPSPIPQKFTILVSVYSARKLLQCTSSSLFYLKSLSFILVNVYKPPNLEDLLVHVCGSKNIISIILQAGQSLLIQNIFLTSKNYNNCIFVFIKLYTQQRKYTQSNEYNKILYLPVLYIILQIRLLIENILFSAL